MWESGKQLNIIIFGQMGSGKTSVANYLSKTYGFNKYSLGTKIHEECKLHKRDEREAYQKYGQMMREIFGIDVWTDYLYDQVKNKNKICIDDGRQLNEYSYFTDKNYLPIGIITDQEKRLERLMKRVNYEIDPATFYHETELQAQKCVDKCDIKIYNNSDYASLIYEIEMKLHRYIEEGGF